VKKLISILVSIMILCVMIDGVLLGEIQSYNLESGKYKENWNREWKVYRPGAEKIRIHFAWIRTEKGYDWVRTSAGDGWTGTYDNIWSRWQYGDTLTITLTSDGSFNADGFKVDKIEVEMQNSSINVPNSDGSSPTNSTSVARQIFSKYQNIRSGQYKNNCNEKWTIKQPGAKRIRVHFVWIRTEKNYDWVKTSASFWDRWTGHHNDVWSRWQYGDTIVITLTSDRSKTDGGFFIDYIEYEI